MRDTTSTEKIKYALNNTFGVAGDLIFITNVKAPQ